MGGSLLLQYITYVAFANLHVSISGGIALSHGQQHVSLQHSVQRTLMGANDSDSVVALLWTGYQHTLISLYIYKVSSL